jgi:hypothetical protein
LPSISASNLSPGTTRSDTVTPTCFAASRNAVPSRSSQGEPVAMIMSIGKPSENPASASSFFAPSISGGFSRSARKNGCVGGIGVTVGVPWPNMAMSVNACRSTILMNASRTRGSVNGLNAALRMMPSQLPQGTSSMRATLLSLT